MSILSVNAGSSSLKFALYPIKAGAIDEAEMTGNIEGLEPSGQPKVAYQYQGKRCEHVIALAPGQDSFEAALRCLNEILQTEFSHLSLQAVAHRVVHGGQEFTHSVLVTPEIEHALSKLNSLAPLHQPHNLAGIRAFSKAFVQVPQVACFDTAFHQSMSPVETTFAIDRTWTQQGIRRYGFHGLSYQYVCGVLQRVAPRAAQRTVMAHLGNGASVCATQAHQSCATSMGFSALDGLMMGTRSGALDPGVLLYLMEQGLRHDDIQNLLYKKSGLLGVSGLSADMRTLRQSDQPSARFAIELFTHRVVREIGAMVACLGGLDVLAFTGGIGEHDAALRADVVTALSFLGVEIDAGANQAAKGDTVAAIHNAHSLVDVWVVPTDEGRVAASQALALI